MKVWPRLPDGLDAEHRRPHGVSVETVSAVGKVSEALEFLERARGPLYSFHQLMGGADLTLGAAVQELREAGYPEQADRLATELIGRNVLAGRWTFQVVQEFDDGYWTAFRDHERRTLTGLWGGSGGAREPPTTQGHLSFGEHTMDEAVGPASGSGELSDAGPLLVLCLEVGAQLDAGLPNDADALLEFRHEYLRLQMNNPGAVKGDGHGSFESGYPDGLPDRTASNRGYTPTHPRRHHPRTCCTAGECLPRFASEVKHPALERRRPPRACEWRPPHLAGSMGQ